MTKNRRISKSIICVLLVLLVFTLRISVHAAQNMVVYDPHAEGIVSSYYAVDREMGFLTGIAPGMTAQQLQKVCLPAQIDFSQEMITTGTTLTANSHTLTAIVTGDLNADGAVTITDMLMLKSRILGQPLTDPAEAAGDINYDGSVTITDFLRVKAHLLGLDKITAGEKADTVPEDALLLLTPESSITWAPQGASAFASDNEALVTVAADGTVTAAAAEGTTFLYALDDGGNILERVMVTVLQEKLTVSFDATSYRVLTGQTQKLNTHFNHPVTPALTWQSSDADIASVDAQGIVTAHKPGVVTVTATLQNGSEATATVTVAPPITAMETDKALYKVKPGNSRVISLVLTPADVEEEFQWTSSDPAIVKVSADGTVTGVSYGTATVTVTAKYSGLTASCKVKVCDVKQVAITFDDGPSAYTPQLLDFLKENDIQVTFFLVANRLETYPNTVRRQVAEGHEVGYHSYAHDIQTGLTSAQISADFEKSDAILKKLTGAQFTLWRTPGGGYSDRVLDCVPLPHIMWSVDTRDWEVRNTDKVYRAIINQSKDGSIILLHDLYSFSVNGAIKAMTEMQAGDYEFVTVTELLSRDGTPPEAGETYFRG